MDDEMVACPYDPLHRMLRKRLQAHLLKCGSRYGKDVLQVCPFDRTHLVPETEFRSHVKDCPGRAIIVQYKYDAPPEEEDRIKHAPIECDENWDDTEVEDYNPTKYVEKANVIRQPIGIHPSQRKAFTKQERKRLGDCDTDDEDEQHQRVRTPPPPTIGGGKSANGVQKDYEDQSSSEEEGEFDDGIEEGEIRRSRTSRNLAPPTEGIRIKIENSSNSEREVTACLPGRLLRSPGNDSKNNKSFARRSPSPNYGRSLEYSGIKEEPKSPPPVRLHRFGGIKREAISPPVRSFDYDDLKQGAKSPPPLRRVRSPNNRRSAGSGRSPRHDKKFSPARRSRSPGSKRSPNYRDIKKEVKSHSPVLPPRSPDYRRYPNKRRSPVYSGLHKYADHSAFRRPHSPKSRRSPADQPSTSIAGRSRALKRSPDSRRSPNNRSFQKKDVDRSPRRRSRTPESPSGSSRPYRRSPDVSPIKKKKIDRSPDTRRAADYRLSPPSGSARLYRRSSVSRRSPDYSRSKEKQKDQSPRRRSPSPALRRTADYKLSPPSGPSRLRRRSPGSQHSPDYDHPKRTNTDYLSRRQSRSPEMRRASDYQHSLPSGPTLVYKNSPEQYRHLKTKDIDHSPHVRSQNYQASPFSGPSRVYRRSPDPRRSPDYSHAKKGSIDLSSRRRSRSPGSRRSPNNSLSTFTDPSRVNRRSPDLRRSPDYKLAPTSGLSRVHRRSPNSQRSPDYRRNSPSSRGTYPGIRRFS